jgi:1-deoxy-D-xylulose-5-phosphate reductoisomerase
MRLPILYALTYPERIASELTFPVQELKRLDFQQPDVEKFPCLRLAYEAAAAGGAKSVALNAADEIAVAAFLAGEIRFVDIPLVIEAVLGETNPRRPESIKEVLSMDAQARQAARGQVAARSKTGRPALA